MTIRSAQRLILDGWVASVRLPGAVGEFEVLGFHVPFIAALVPGRIWVDPGASGAGMKVLPVRGGLAWLGAGRLSVVVEEVRR